MQSWKGDRFSLRCLLFCFFGGIGCLIPYLPMHMTKVGLTEFQSYIVSIVAPLVAALGPLVVSPLADRIGEAGGRSLRILLGIVILLSAVFYPILMCIPIVSNSSGGQSGMSLICNSEGSDILQMCCSEEKCYDWPEINSGVFELNDCRYDCDAQSTYLTGEEPTISESPVTDDEVISEVTLNPIIYKSPDADNIDINFEEQNEDNQDQENVDEEDLEENDYEDINEDEDDGSERRRRDLMVPSNDTMLHICVKNENNHTECHVYTKDNNGISLESNLIKATRVTKNCNKFCHYSVNGNVSCHIPKNSRFSSCKVRCDLSPSSSFKDNVLIKSDCWSTENNKYLTFWTYLLVRSIADIFPTTAVGLLDAAIIIATCETNLGHGDVGRELAFGSLGFAVFAPIIGLLNTFVSQNIPYLFSFVAYIILMLISMMILLFANSMPLSRPEWWSRHARVMPLGGVKRHLSELICFVCVLVILGCLWSGIDSYLPLHLTTLGGLDYLLGLTLTIGSLPAIPLLWNSERVIEFCGHINLLIIAFIFYIVRYAAYSYITVVWWTLISEALEVFTMSVLWVTVLLYMRQLVPRHLTVTSQGMAVFFHFCLGRCLGAVFAALICTYTGNEHSVSLIRVYQVGAVVSAIVATLYFMIYHCFLKCCCQPEQGQTLQDHQEVLQGPTSNGTYTPLRIYHNGSGQKDQISY